MRLGVILATVLLCYASVFAIDDTVDNRTAQADRYLQASPPKEMLLDMVEAMTEKMQPAQKKTFQELMLKYFDIEEYSKDMKDALVKHFTADELSALADFYNSPTGKSILKKMKLLTAEIMPKAQAQSMKAIQKMLSEKVQKQKQQQQKALPNSSM
jgi:hypothetical protein